MIDVLIDALIDSVKVFCVVLAVYILLSFFEVKLANRLAKKNKLSPFFGSLFGLVPQCGISVVASDLYSKKHISLGTILAVFIVCSDEAIPIILASGNQKSLMIIPMLAIKFIIGLSVGFLVDFLMRRNKKEVEYHLEHCHHEEEVKVGCCHHEINATHEHTKWEEHLWHPLFHSLKLWVYVFAINLIFGIIIYFVKEETLISFLQVNKYIAPFFATILGMIPNCASSIILADLFVLDAISFGACLAGLCMNAGLGLIFLFKKKENYKNNLLILGILFGVSVIVGYVTCLIAGF